MIRYRVHGRDNHSNYVLGIYTYKWVAWLRGTAHIMRAPGRYIFIDAILTNDY